MFQQESRQLRGNVNIELFFLVAAELTPVFKT